MTKEHYICQRAANAILSENGSFQISSDALQAVNQFLDQCLYLVLQNARSLDLSLIKTHLLALLPYRLGRNAIVEAELEIKAYNETNTVDMELYERVRSSTDPLHELLASLRTQCLKQCALADKAATGEEKEEEAMVNGVALSPMVVIYVTTVLEHLAEYILTTIGVTAERQGSDYIRVKEVYWALLQDVQVGGLFKQTELRSKLEKRVMSSYSMPHYQHHSPEPESPTFVKGQPPLSRDTFEHRTPELYSDLDDDDDDDDDDEILPSNHTTRTSSSIKSGQSTSSYRPVSVLSNGTTATNRSSSSSKKGFRFFGKKGKKRSSVASQSTTGTTASNQQHHHYQQERLKALSPVSDSPSSVQVYDIDTPALDFEDLIRSGNTMKVSLTPSRLRSIEVKSANTRSPAKSNISSPTRSPPPPSTAPQPSPTGAPFENPRAAPKPPIHADPSQKSATPPTTPNASIASRLSNARASPPIALQLVDPKSHRTQPVIDTPTTVSAMDLPSPPSTMDHPITLFSDPQHPPPTTHNTTSFDRPSTIVAKRASGRARPASYHENIALEQQQQRRLAPSLHSDRTLMRRRRPFSQIITEEEVPPPSTLPPPSLPDKDTVQQRTAVDVSIQTEPLPGIPTLASLLATQRAHAVVVPTLVITEDDTTSEQGLVDGDEEWFIQDWDDVDR